MGTGYNKKFKHTGKKKFSKKKGSYGKGKTYTKKSSQPKQITVNYKNVNPNKYVIIVEKPSVARQFAKAFGLKGREVVEGITVHKGKYKNNDLYVVPLAGHILELDFNEGGKWIIPLIPPKEIKFKPIYGKTKFLKVIKKLVSDAYIVFATDWDREGELISYEVFTYLRVPADRHFRMTYSSLQAKELKESFEKALKTKQKLDLNLAHAGLLRAYVDKLYGFNYTRLMTLAVKNVASDPKVWSVGRVQTPTLRTLYEKFKEIEEFVPSPIIKIKMLGKYYDKNKNPIDKNDVFISEGILLPTKYIKEHKQDKWVNIVTKFKLAVQLLEKLGFVMFLKKDGKLIPISSDNDGVKLIMENIKTKKDAESQLVLKRVVKKLIIIPVVAEKSREHEKPPKLFSTTLALSELSKTLKMKSTDVMKQLQSMYEKAVISYVRTDSEIFDEKKYDEAFHKGRLNEIAKIQIYGAYIRSIKTFKPRNKGSKIDDAHPPIHPVSSDTSSLSPVQKKIYDIIARRYIASFYPDFVQDKLRVKLKTPIDFSKTFTKIVNPGWKQVTNPEIITKMKKEKDLPNFDLVKYFAPSTISLEFEETRPPEMYTTASIIKKMEELKLGTKSTRAQIIQSLINRGYITVDSKNKIKVTQKGKDLIRLIDNVDDEHIQLISRPAFTAMLEDKMDLVNKGKEDYKKVIEENINIIKGVTPEKKKKITKAYLTLT